MTDEGLKSVQRTETWSVAMIILSRDLNSGDFAIKEC